MKHIFIHPESRTLLTVLRNVYRKGVPVNDRYEKTVMDGLEKLNLVKKVSSKKGVFFFKTEKSNNFKAIDFAIEFLWNFHNAEKRTIIDDQRYILCYDSYFENGQKLVEIKEAVKMKIV